MGEWQNFLSPTKLLKRKEGVRDAGGGSGVKMDWRAKK
jgi:hypothetical protein